MEEGEEQFNGVEGSIEQLIEDGQNNTENVKVFFFLPPMP